MNTPATTPPVLFVSDAQTSEFRTQTQSQSQSQSNLNLEHTVVATFGRYFLVQYQGEVLECVTKGRNQEVVVGDVVTLKVISDRQARIESVVKRKNLLHRSDAYKSKAFAANLDRVIWVLAPEPMFYSELLDRAIVACENIGIPLTIILNKSDLDLTIANKTLRTYHSLGYAIHILCKDQADAVQTCFEHFAGERVMLLGQSGMGKSSILNALSPDLALKTREISTALNTGKHTTTHTRLYQINLASQAPLQVIDSPGFQVFGMHHLSITEIMRGFVEFLPHLGHCKFHNCQHISEPGCAILTAMNKGSSNAIGGMIDEKRHSAYAKLIDEHHKQNRAHF